MKYLLFSLSLCLLQSDSYTIKLVSITSKNRMDYMPRKFKDGIVFTSSPILHEPKAGESKLYFSKIINGEQLSKPIKIKVKKYRGLELGVMDILPSTNELFVTINDPFEEGSNDKMLSLGLCTGIMEGFSIKNLAIVSFCKPGVMYCHPTISDDGKVLIFSSNAEKKDIQIFQSTRSTLDSDWSAPEPIEELAIKGNCFFPNLINDSLLVFSSSMEGGKGGLDIYTSKKIAGKWSKPENWAELNSESDDSSLEMIDEKSGYLSSSRDGSFDKLYYFRLGE